MKDRFVPYSKLSKKEKKRIDAMKRRSWSGLDPSTRRVPSARAYSRKVKHKGRVGEEG